MGVIQAHLLRPSAKQSPLLPPPPATLSSFSSTSFLLPTAHAPTAEETDPLRLTTFLRLEEDDSQDEEASEEYEAVMEALFFLRREEQRDEHCLRVVVGEAGGSGFFFVFSSFDSMVVVIFLFSSFIPGGFLCSLFPVGPRTDLKSLSPESVDRNRGGTDIEPINERMLTDPTLKATNFARFREINIERSTLYSSALTANETFFRII